MSDALRDKWLEFQRWNESLTPKSTNPGPHVAENEMGGKPETAAHKEKPMFDFTSKEHQVANPSPSLNVPVDREPRYEGTVEMTPKEWAEIEENPRQRDTEKRASKAAHLKTPHPTHRRVSAGRFPNGALIKLDGHTRSYLWQTGKVESPPTIFVDIWSCADLATVKNMYKTFDSPDAVESTTDEVFGALRDLGIEFKSDLLKQKRFVAATRHAHETMYGKRAASLVSPYDLTHEWKAELVLLDSISPTRTKFPTAIVVAVLLTFRRYRSAATGFWDDYARGLGTKVDGRMDPVQALSERLASHRRSERLSGRENVMKITIESISAFEKHRQGGDYNVTAGGIRAFDSKGWRRWVESVRSSSRSKKG